MSRRAAALVTALFLGAGILVHRMSLLMTYPDSRAYRALADVPVHTGAFWYGIRPPGVPLLLKLSPDDATITHVQAGLYLVCSLALAAAAARWMRSPRGQLLAFSSLLLLALLPHHFLWCRSISSESLTFSLFFLLLALASLLVRRPRDRMWQIAAPIALVVVAALFVFTRDANGYFLIFLSGAVLAAALWKRERRLDAAIALTIACVLTGICARQATVAGRWRWPFINILGQRVLKQPDRLAFFQAHGMPVNPKVMCFANQRGDYCNEDLSGFGTWLEGDIKGLYARYLLSHPVESLLAPLHTLGQTVYHRHGHKGLYLYFHESPAWYAWPGRLWFQSDVTVAILAILALLGLRNLSKAQATQNLAAPAVLLAAVPPMLFFVHHGDAAEPMRHAVLVASLLRLGLWLAILITYDRMGDGAATLR